MNERERRLQLHAELKAIMGDGPVYFQPPEGMDMEIPCIVYKRNRGVTRFADNNPYSHKKQYLVTYIDPDPDSLIPSMIAAMPTCVFDRHYTAENLNHDVYELFH